VASSFNTKDHVTGCWFCILFICKKYPCYMCVSVESLVVSAGDSHQIQLPTDSITLYAFVLDDNSGGVFFTSFSTAD